MNDFNNNDLNYEEKSIADSVADEILTVEEDDNKKIPFYNNYIFNYWYNYYVLKQHNAK